MALVAALALGLTIVLLTVGSSGLTDRSGADAAAAESAAKPNVIVIQTDDQDLGSLRVMRNVHRLLAAQGTTFSANFATNPLCCPSRATLLTGQYSHNHGVAAYAQLDESETLPVWLQRAGYVTGHIGKYLNGYGLRDPSHVPPGWSEWYGSVDYSTYRMYGYTLNENGLLRTYSGRPADYQTDVYADKAVGFVRRQASGGPFFLSVNPLAPHSEGGHGGGVYADGPQINRNPRPAQRHYGDFRRSRLPTPPSFDEEDVSDKPRFVRARPPLGSTRKRRMRQEYRSRLESLLAVDEMVARVVAAVRRTGELDNTVIAFTSDNGWMQGEHRVPRGKVILYEESVRVPLVIRGPGFERSAVSERLTGNVDLAPTILDLADAEPAGRLIDGRSLLSAVPRRGAGWRSSILLENKRRSEAVRTARFSYMEHESGERELYDLRSDPYQLRNVAGTPTYRETGRRMAARLDELRACAGTSCR